MCLQCSVNPFYFTDVLPGWDLIRARRNDDEMKMKEWGLVQCNDPSIIFKTTPILYEDNEQLDKAIEEFSNELICEPYIGFKLCSAFNKIEHDEDLFDKYIAFGFNEKFYVYLADFIQKANPTLDTDPFPHLDAICDHDYEYDPKKP
jgi:hypothetical protein